jgi:capsular polysaccharide biosynthesis protein
MINFGYSFQDVPGLQLSECRLIELDNCRVEMLLDEWDSVFTDVLQGKNRVKFRGSTNLRKNAQKELIGSWERAALPLEIWNGNYGHWIAYHLPKLLSFIENGWRDHIILPERGRWSNVEERDATFLSLIDRSVKGHLRLRQGVTEVRKLAIIDGDPHHAATLGRVANRLLGHVSQTSTLERQRLYISRSNAGYRKLVNEHQLVTELRNLGFETIALEDLPIARQIEAFSKAACVVAMHGSGLANMIFCPSDAKIIEVIANDFPSPDFYRLATTIGLDYCLLIGESVGDGKPGYRNMVAPIDTIAALVKELLP